MNNRQIEELIVKLTLDIAIDNKCFCSIENLMEATQNKKELQNKLLEVNKAVLILSSEEKMGKIYFEFGKEEESCIVNSSSTAWLINIISPILRFDERIREINQKN